MLVGSHDSAVRSAGVPVPNPKEWEFMPHGVNLQSMRAGTCG